MARANAAIPALRYHISGQLVCTIGGKNFYLGPHDQAATNARYAVLIEAYQANGYRIPDGFCIDDVKALTDARFSPLVVGQQTEGPVLVRHVTAAWRLEAGNKYANQHAEKLRCNQVCDELDLHDGGSVNHIGNGLLK